jgi:cytoskeletal protein CcmA (bactofilin family)
MNVRKDEPIDLRSLQTANQVGQSKVDIAPHSRPALAATGGESVIGKDLTILGDTITIISANRLRIEGRVRGDVAGKEVVIGLEGSVTGTVSAEAIEIFGGVQGSILGMAVTLHDTAHVDGEIVHASLVMAKGAHFDGKVRRLTDRKALMAKHDPNSYVSRVR